MYVHFTLVIHNVVRQNAEICLHITDSDTALILLPNTEYYFVNYMVLNSNIIEWFTIYILFYYLKYSIN